MIHLGKRGTQLMAWRWGIALWSHHRRIVWACRDYTPRFSERNGYRPMPNRAGRWSYRIGSRG